MEKAIAGTVLMVLISFSNVRSAPSVNADKLSFLGQHGYEVISGVEEFIAPVDSNNKIDNVESPNPLVQPDMLLYGKFYVLRKKGLHQNPLPLKTEEEARKITLPAGDSNLPSSIGSRSVYQSLQQKYNTQDDQADDSIITFPNDSTTKSPKKYKYVPNIPRQGTQQNDESLSTNTRRHSRIFPRPAETLTPITSAATTLPEPTPPTHKLNQEDEEFQSFQHYSSNELVDWVVQNLKTHQIQKLIKGEDISDISTEDFSDEGQLELANKHFIQTPSRIASCPEGQRRNHQGKCVKPYVHRVKSSNLQAQLKRGNAQVKLAALFRAMIKAETELLKDAKAIEEIVAEATPTKRTTIAATTTTESPTTSASSASIHFSER